MSRDLKEVKKLVLWMPREEYSRQREQLGHSVDSENVPGMFGYSEEVSLCGEGRGGKRSRRSLRGKGGRADYIGYKELL